MQRIEFRAMGCQMLALLDTDASATRDTLARVPEWFAAWEDRLSRFRDDTELALLNRTAGPVTVSETLWDVVQAALEAARESGGLVTPTLLDALEGVGYDRSFEAGASAAVQPPAAEAHAPDWRAIQVDTGHHSISLPAGLRLDLGGVAKGWAADSAAHRLSHVGPALVDAGGDLAISGPRADGSAWLVGVADPFDPQRDLALLDIVRGGVATSGRDYRRWRQGATWRHHIIDPRTALPASTDVMSVTAIAPSAREAEVAAKVALILGSQEGVAWLDARPWLAGLLVLEDGQVVGSRFLPDYLHSDV